MIEKIFDRSRRWKEKMISELGLSRTLMQFGFAELIVEAQISTDQFRQLCVLVSWEIGTFTYDEINYLHTLEAYRIVLEVMCDDEIQPQGDIFWLNHPDFPEVVFERVMTSVEAYKAYVVNPEIAAGRRSGDSLLIWVPDLERIADVAFVSQIPPATEAKRQAWYKSREK